MTTTNNPLSAQSGPPRKEATFDVILADPPWDVQQKGRNSLGAERHYDLLTLDQIKGMGDAVKSLAADNAHLWLWVTNATLRQGYDVMEAWGFTPRSPLTWIKPRFTLGVYLRNATEHVLFGTRGKAPVLYKSQPTWMFAPLQEHSVKPDELFSVIDRVSGTDTRKLELFARRRPPAPNWSVWGDQIDADVSLAAWGYPVPSDYDDQEPLRDRSAVQEDGREG